MVSHLFFSQLVLIALVWLCLMLQWAWPSDPAAAVAHTPTAKTPPCAHPLCGPHHQAALRRLCIQQCPSPTDTLSPATPHRAHAGAPPPGRHLDTFLPEPGLYVPRMGRMGQPPCQWPSQWRSLASAAVYRLSLLLSG